MRILATIAALLILPAVAIAQEPAQTPEALSRVYSCAEQADDVQRLACYDEAIGRLREAESTGQVVAVDRQQADTLERESFGFRLPSLARVLPTLTGSDDPLDSLSMQVTDIVSRPEGRAGFVMANEQVWVQVEPQRTSNVRAGDTVTIRRAAMGSYMLVSPRGGAGHRVRRVD